MPKRLSENHELIETLRRGGVAVVRTDTLYGLVARADDRVAVERVYGIKSRDQLKSCIILLDTTRFAYDNHVELDADVHRYHDVPTSFLIESPHAPTWLLRKNSELAYRVPADENLRGLLKKTGPLIAPSANPEGLPPARTIQEAKEYFGDRVDMYVDGGEVPADTQPSQLLRINKDGHVERLR